MKFNKKYLILLFIVLLTTRCDKLADLNENPNQPEEVSADVLLTSTIRSSVNSMVNESFLLGNNIAQLTAKTLRTEVDVYSWNAFTTVWEEMYASATNILEVEKIAKSNNNSNMLAVAKVMKSWIFANLTLAYGDIPYSEAIKGVDNDNWFPAYDSQSEIITGAGGLLDELKTANDLFNTGTENISGDILFNGDKSKWQKLTNSLRLRLLMYISNKQDVAGEFAQIVNGAPIMTSNNDNAVLVYTGNFPNEFPLIPLKQGDFDAVVMSTSSVNVMTNTNDPRLGIYARPANIIDIVENSNTAAEYDGGVNGLETGDCDKSGSRLGLAYYNYPGHPKASEKADGIIMTYAEVEFLLAEAAQKGWISNDTETHYRNGIKASMNYYKVNYAEFGWNDFSDFYQGSGVSYDGELVTIWKQKWLSLFFHGLEPYFEIRRWMYESDFDWMEMQFVSPPCQNNNNDQLPMRFLYPGNEQSLNPDNYSMAVENLGGNTQNTKMWVVK